jgi:hypothetical protein
MRTRDENSSLARAAVARNPPTPDSSPPGALAEPVIEHSDQRGNMGSSDLASTSLQSIAERGLCAFLQAIAEVAPGEDPQKAGDRWIRAMETTHWSLGESADKFICHVTINALAINAEHNSPRFRESP